MKNSYKKNPWKRLVAGMLAMVFLLGGSLTAEASGQSVVALGADLNEQQRATVLGLMGLGEADLAECKVVTITNDMEHQYLGQYLDASIIGTKSLSSVRVIPLEEGSGLNITTHNISYCTISMY